MKNILLIAKREFLATVATRAFIIGLFILPAIIAIFALIGPRLFSQKNFQVKGEVLVIDPTGRITPELQKTFDPARIKARREEESRKALSGVPQQVQQIAGNAVNKNIRYAMDLIPELHILERPANSDIEQEKAWLNKQPQNMPHLALIVIHKNAVEPVGAAMEYGSYDIYVPPKLDDRAGGEIQRGLREAIVNARIQARAIDKTAMDAILNFPNVVRSVTVTENNQRQTVQGFNVLLPAVFGFLLFMGTMGGGGQLLNSTVEEKSSRVVEVLLSAVSPMELMAGKLLGQLGVSLVGMGLYIVLGIALLAGFALLGLLNFSLIFYLIIFFLITYLVMGSLMMAIGAAVNDIKEAQSLMMPLTLVFMIPWILWMPISRDPGSALSITMSFLPPVNTFAMLLRMTSNTPPPLWQVWLSIGIGIGSAFCAIWFAAKVFRIGLLMFGKAPNFATLIRWVRSA
jgi:ABC-2 type transport system permease protein